MRLQIKKVQRSASNGNPGINERGHHKTRLYKTREKRKLSLVRVVGFGPLSLLLLGFSVLLLAPTVLLLLVTTGCCCFHWTVRRVVLLTIISHSLLLSSLLSCCLLSVTPVCLRLLLVPLLSVLS